MPERDEEEGHNHGHGHSVRLDNLEDKVKTLEGEMRSFHNFRVNVYILLAFIAGTGIMNLATAAKLIHFP